MISVVVPTRNEEEAIRPLLASIPLWVELVVVDSGEDMLEKVLKSERSANLVFIKKEVNIATARQMGAEASRGDIIVFSDADVFFCDDYFSRLPALIEKYDAVYGTKFSHKKEFLLYYALFDAGQKACHILGIPAASGSNMACKRHAFAKVGFDVRLPCNEDTEFFFRLKHAGFRVGRIDLPVFSTTERRLEKGVCRKFLHNLARNVLLFLNFYIKIPRRLLENDWGYWR